MGESKQVDHILLAEFDIEKGSIISFQYPTPTGTETNILAELMLPDGAHNQDQDWTTFFLNQKMPEGFKPRETKSTKSVKRIEAYIYQFTENSQDWEMIGEDKKRIRLEEEFITIVEQDGKELFKIARGSQIDFQQMEPLYDVMIYDDKAIGIRLNDESDEKSLLNFLEEFAKPLPEKKEAPEESAEPAKKPFLYVLNLVRTKHIPGVKRGARTKAMAICTRHQYVHIFKPLLLLALDSFFDTPEEAVLKKLYDAINSMDLGGLTPLTVQEKRIIRASEGSDPNSDKKYFKTKVNYSGIDIPMKVPVAMFPDEVGEISVTNLVNKFANSQVGRENAVMVIFNALLKQQRIIFLGYNHPAAEVASYVMAACALIAPPMRGFIERAFPYTNLTHVDYMLAFNGFIAGVTNPRYEDIDKWWDVLCNVETGTVKFAPHVQLPSEPEKYVSLDNEFIADVNFCIQNRYSEERIRAKFQEYAQQIVDIAFDEAEFPDEATKKKFVTLNQPRIDFWKKTSLYQNNCEDRELFKKERAIKDVDVNRLISRLRIRQSMPEKEVLSIYQDFVSSINTDEQLIEFLSYLPENQGGLYPVAVSLFHPSELVRKSTVELFSRIDKLKAGSGFINGMNAFLRLGYERNKYLLDRKSDKDILVL